MVDLDPRESNLMETSDETKRRIFNEFFKLVKEMRAAQREYFAHRSVKNLDQSKTLERAVDAKIREIQSGYAFNPVKQATLGV